MSFNVCPAPVGGVSMISPIASVTVVSTTSFLRQPTPPPRRALPKRSDIINLVAGCEQELRLVQTRLGTPAERAEDQSRARELAHKAKNLRFAIELWEQMNRRNEEPRPAA